MIKDRDADLPEEVMWEGRFITTKKRGRWEYVGRARGIRAAAIIALDEDADGTRHINVPQEQQARILLQQTVEQAAQQRLEGVLLARFGDQRGDDVKGSGHIQLQTRDERDAQMIGYFPGR